MSHSSSSPPHFARVGEDEGKVVGRSSSETVSASETDFDEGVDAVDTNELEALDAHIRRLQAEIQHAHRKQEEEEHAAAAAAIPPTSSTSSATPAANKSVVRPTSSSLASGLPPLSPRFKGQQRSDSPPPTPLRDDNASALLPASTTHRSGQSSPPSSSPQAAYREGDGDGRRSVSPPYQPQDGDAVREEDEDDEDNGSIMGEPDAYGDSASPLRLNNTANRSNNNSLHANYLPHHQPSHGAAPPFFHRAQSNNSNYSTGVVYEAGDIDMAEVVTGLSGGARRAPPIASTEAPCDDACDDADYVNSGPAMARAASVSPSPPSTQQQQPQRRDLSPSSSSPREASVRRGERDTRETSEPLKLVLSPSRSPSRGGNIVDASASAVECPSNHIDAAVVGALVDYAVRASNTIASIAQTYAAYSFQKNNLFADSSAAVVCTALGMARAERAREATLHGSEVNVLTERLEAAGAALEELRMRIASEAAAAASVSYDKTNGDTHRVDGGRDDGLNEGSEGRSSSQFTGVSVSNATESTTRSASRPRRDPMSLSVVSATTLGGPPTTHATPTASQSQARIASASAAAGGGVGGRASLTAAGRASSSEFGHGGSRSLARHSVMMAMGGGEGGEEGDEDDGRGASPSIGPERLSETHAANINKEEMMRIQQQGSSQSAPRGVASSSSSSARFSLPPAATMSGGSILAAPSGGSRSNARSSTVLRASHENVADDDDEPSVRVSFAPIGNINDNHQRQHDATDAAVDDDEPSVSPRAVQDAARAARDKLRAFSETGGGRTASLPPSFSAASAKQWAVKTASSIVARSQSSPSRGGGAANASGAAGGGGGVGGRALPSAASVYAWSKNAAMNKKASTASAAGQQQQRGVAGANGTLPSFKTTGANTTNKTANATIASSSFGLSSDVQLILEDPLRLSEDLAVMYDFVAAVSETLAVPAESRRELLAHLEANYGDKLRLARNDILALREEKMAAIVDARKQRQTVAKLKERMAELEKSFEALQKKHGPLVASYSAMQTEYGAVVKRQQKAEESAKKIGDDAKKSVPLANAMLLVESIEEAHREVIKALEADARRLLQTAIADYGVALAEQLETFQHRVTVGGSPLRRFGINGSAQPDAASTASAVSPAEYGRLQESLRRAEEESVRLRTVSKSAADKYLDSLAEVAQAHEELAALSKQLSDAQEENEKLAALVNIAKEKKEDAAAVQSTSAAEEAKRKKQIEELTAELSHLREQMEPLQVEVVSARRREAAVLKAAHKDKGEGANRTDEEAAEAMLKSLQSENERLVAIVRSLQKAKEKAATPPPAPTSPTLQELAESGATHAPPPPPPPSSSAFPAGGGSNTSSGAEVQRVVIPQQQAPSSSPSPSAARAGASASQGNTNASSNFSPSSTSAAPHPIMRDIAEDTLDFARKRLTMLEDAFLRSVEMSHAANSGSSVGGTAGVGDAIEQHFGYGMSRREQSHSGGLSHHHHHHHHQQHGARHHVDQAPPISSPSSALNDGRRRSYGTMATKGQYADPEEEELGGDSSIGGRGGGAGNGGSVSGKRRASDAYPQQQHAFHSEPPRRSAVDTDVTVDDLACSADDYRSPIVMMMSPHQHQSHQNRSGPAQKRPSPPRAIPSTPQRSLLVVGGGRQQARARTPPAPAGGGGGGGQYYQQQQQQQQQQQRANFPSFDQEGYYPYDRDGANHSHASNRSTPSSNARGGATGAEIGLRDEMRHWHDVVLRAGGHMFGAGGGDGHGMNANGNGPAVRNNSAANTNVNSSMHNEYQRTPTYTSSMSPMRR